MRAMKLAGAMKSRWPVAKYEIGGGGPGQTRTATAFAAVLQTVRLANAQPTHSRPPPPATSVGYRTRSGETARRHNGAVARGYARYVLAVMVGINFLNYMDRYVGAALVTPIKNEFHLSDAQVGLLATAFLLV